MATEWDATLRHLARVRNVSDSIRNLERRQTHDSRKGHIWRAQWVAMVQVTRQRRSRVLGTRLSYVSFCFFELAELLLGERCFLRKRLLRPQGLNSDPTSNSALVLVRKPMFHSLHCELCHFCLGEVRGVHTCFTCFFGTFYISWRLKLSEVRRLVSIR